MSKFRNQDFLRGTGERQTLVLNLTAAGVIVVVALVLVAYLWVYPRLETADTLDLAVDVPAVAPGIHTGTKVILRGAEVGEVKGLTRHQDDSVRMSLSLQPGEIQGLTDAFDLDFRPENYFGVSAVNLVGKPTGDPLQSGQVLDRMPSGDFTMSTMIEKGSLVVNGTLTQSMIATLDKVIRYTDGLTPMIQTGIVVADRMSQTQQAMPSVLLADLNRTLTVLPGFSQQAIDALYNMYDNDSQKKSQQGSLDDEKVWWADMNEGLDLVLGGLFSAAGKLLESHMGELTPATQMVTALTSAVPNLLDGGAAASKLSQLVDRYGKAYSGPEGSKTLNMRVVLDDLPSFTTPMTLIGVPYAPQPGAPR
ncbi:Mce family protein [Nocardia sp. CA-135953]|uniref:Mce family protein n=1 Tax=Nocardia sp. CA-135953 TaxID=3239978 RepID=UPI003D9516A3